jgi:hypothetical protein
VRVRGAAGLSLHAVLGTEVVTVEVPQVSSVRMVSPGGVSSRGTVVGSGVQRQTVDVHGIVCIAPCESVLPESTYTFAIGRDGAHPQTFDRPFLLDRDLTLDLWHQDREVWRVLGWTLVVAGPVGAGALVLAADFTRPYPAGVDEPMLISGLVGGSVLLLLGAALAALNDGVEIRLVGDEAPSEPVRERRRRDDSFEP